MSVWALKVMNVAYGGLRASGGWRMKDHKCEQEEASLASRASALSSVKPLAKTHSEIMGAVRYGCLVKDMWCKTTSVMDCDRCLIDLCQMRVMANDQGR